MNTSTSNSTFSGDFVDWGNNSNLQSSIGTGWRTLSKDEWMYVFYGRPSANKGSTVGTTNYASYAHASITIGSTTYNGMLLFPDGGSFTNAEATWGTINGNSNWGTKCTEAQWSALATKGCVFLPASGYRNGTLIEWVESYGYCSSSSPYGSDGRYYVRFYSNGLEPALSYASRCTGYHVRLVHDTL